MSCKQRKTQTNESTPHVYFHTQIAFFANLSSSKCIHGDLYGFLLLCTCIGFRAPSVVAPASSPLILTIAIPEVPPRRLAQATRGRLGFPPSAATLVCLPSSPSPVASGRPAAAAGPLPPPPPSIPALVPLPARRLSSSGGLLPLGAVRSGSCCCSAWRGSVWDGASEWCSLRWLERPASRELLASSEMGERGPLDLGRRPFRRDSIGLTGARWCWPFFFGHGGGRWRLWCGRLGGARSRSEGLRLLQPRLPPMVLLWAAFVAGVVPVWWLEVGGGSGEIRGQQCWSRRRRRPRASYPSCRRRPGLLLPLFLPPSSYARRKPKSLPDRATAVLRASAPS
uniref:Uncharacterized protein n=1 Tax=Triticum urartu TaxID=4572 RepID=A0A8R7R5M4_TRIUA